MLEKEQGGFRGREGRDFPWHKGTVREERLEGVESGAGLQGSDEFCGELKGQSGLRDIGNMYPVWLQSIRGYGPREFTTPLPVRKRLSSETAVSRKRMEQTSLKNRREAEAPGPQ